MADLNYLQFGQQKPFGSAPAKIGVVLSSPWHHLFLSTIDYHRAQIDAVTGALTAETPGIRLSIVQLRG